MSSENLSENFRPVDVLNLLIARHGLLRVILALPAALLKRRPVAELLIPPISAHLARDIGVLQEPVRQTRWDYR